MKPDQPSRRYACALYAAAVLSAIAPATAASSPGSDLRQRVPTPGQQTTGLTEFVGTTTDGRFGVAIVRDTHGAVIAYACDGRRLGRWLTGLTHGGNVALRGRLGTRLIARWHGDRVTGTVGLAGHTHRFTLERARAGAGLRRFARRGVESGWILTNDGLVVGTANKAGKSIAAVEAGGADSGGADASTDGAGSGTGTAEPPAGGSTSTQDKATKCADLEHQRFNLQNKIKNLRERVPVSSRDQETIDFATSSILLITRQEERLGCF